MTAPLAPVAGPGRREEVLGRSAEGTSVIEVQEGGDVLYEYRLGAVVLASALTLHALVEALRAAAAAAPAAADEGCGSA